MDDFQISKIDHAQTAGAYSAGKRPPKLPRKLHETNLDETNLDETATTASDRVISTSR